MKNTINRCVLVAGMLLLFGYMNKAYCQSNEITIIDMKDKEKPPPDIFSHKQGDVEVYKTIDIIFGQPNYLNYTFVFYRNEEDTLRHFGADFITETYFDRATYKWENDTMVAVTLHNSETREKKQVKVWGKGNTNGMIIDEE